jgi:hypothetical protein
MILYVPSSEAEGMLELISKHGDKILHGSTMYDLKEQIREQMPKQTKTVNLNELIEEKVKIYCDFHKKNEQDNNNI